MDSARLPRKLAAILYADVAGYSRLTGEDEEGTHRRLSEYLDLFTMSIQAHDGTVVHFAGDAVLADFQTATDAVQCALSAQQALRSRNKDLPEDRRVQFRIGVNLGEVIVDRDDIYGDGVNVAARLEGLAEPGGICVSEAVRSAVGIRLPIAYQDLGKQRVKNIDEPVLAYRVKTGDAPAVRVTLHPRQRTIALAAAVIVVATAAALLSLRPWHDDAVRSNADEPVAATDGKLSLAVLPFTNRSDDPSQSYFANGITDDLTTDLSQLSRLRVIARDSSRRVADESLAEIREALGVQYVLKGSVRRAGDAVRINVELVEASSGGNVWAERYDGLIHDVFALQDRVTRQIVQELAVTLTDAERAELGRRFTSDSAAYDYLLRGNSQVSRFSAESNAEARSMYLAALARDPFFARAHGGLALTHAFDWRFGWTADRDASLELAHGAAREAVRLAPNLAQAHFAHGVALTYMRRSGEAVDAARRATEINPNYADAHALLSFALTHAGRASEGLDAIDDAIRLNPAVPWLYSFHRGRALFFLERYEEAIADFQSSVEKNPSFVVTHIYLTAAYAQVGHSDDAEWASMEVLTLSPDFQIDTWLTSYGIFTDAQYRERLGNALRKTDLPP